MNIPDYAKITCWTSIVLLLWGMVFKVVENSFMAWFALWFFVVALILVIGATWSK